MSADLSLEYFTPPPALRAPSPIVTFTLRRLITERMGEGRGGGGNKKTPRFLVQVRGAGVFTPVTGSSRCGLYTSHRESPPEQSLPGDGPGSPCQSVTHSRSCPHAGWLRPHPQYCTSLSHTLLL